MPHVKQGDTKIIGVAIFVIVLLPNPLKLGSLHDSSLSQWKSEIYPIPQTQIDPSMQNGQATLKKILAVNVYC